jgi:type VI secretion system secreted protein Hcp
MPGFTKNRKENMRKRSVFALVAVVAAAAAVAVTFGLLRPQGAVGAGPPAQAVGTLQIEGLTEPGQPIDVLAYSWGLSSSGTIAGGGGGAGKVNIQDLSFTKSFDTLSPRIVRALAQGEHFATATLLVNATGQPGAATHRYVFDEVLLTSDSHGGSGGSRLTENVTINFAAFQFQNVG